jgi:hypothetical protein
MEQTLVIDEKDSLLIQLGLCAIREIRFQICIDERCWVRVGIYNVCTCPSPRAPWLLGNATGYNGLVSNASSHGRQKKLTVSYDLHEGHLHLHWVVYGHVW